MDRLDDILEACEIEIVNIAEEEQFGYYLDLQRCFRLADLKTFVLKIINECLENIMHTNPDKNQSDERNKLNGTCSFGQKFAWFLTSYTVHEM